MFSTSLIRAFFLFIILLCGFSPDLGLSIGYQFAGYALIIACLFWVLYEIIGTKRVPTINISLSEIIIVIFILYAITSMIVVKRVLPFWISNVIAFFLFFKLMRRIEWNMLIIASLIVVLGLIEALLGIGQYFNLLTNHNVAFKIVGTFSNPAGLAAALCAMIPFTFFLIRSDRKLFHYIGVISCVIFIVSIFATKSRAGIVTLFALGCVLVMQVINKRHRKYVLFLLVLLGVIILYGLSQINPHSVNGRFLIWNCSWQMIQDQPVFGYGCGGFEKEYMLYQAAYFADNKDDVYAILADNVKHPFNEYILFAVNYGVFGFIFLISFIYIIWIEYRNNIRSSNQFALLSVIAIAIFSGFSYPLFFPSIFLILIISVSIVLHHEASYITININRLMKSILVVSVSLLLTFNVIMYNDEYHWRKAASKVLIGQKKQIVLDYESLYQKMYYNPLFLYNLGAVLNYVGYSETSNRILTQCCNFYNDFYMQLLMAENYMQLKRYKQAEKSLVLASNMIPNRFTPIFRLFKLYNQLGDTTKARQCAQILIDKTEKVNSDEINRMKKEAAYFLVNQRGE